MMLIPPVSRPNYRNFAVEKSLFSADECLQVIEFATALPAAEATIGERQRAVLSDYRRSTIRWLERSEETQFLFDRIAKLVSCFNERYFGFALSGFMRGLQYAEYEKGGKFDWHMDFGPGDASCRKISVTVLLNEAAEFEGGAFETLTYGNARAIEMGRGDAIVFPSYVVHRITQISRGHRCSLVAWIYGPGFA
jgi:PKHD-type hydroxylase